MGRSDIKHVLGALRRADNKFNLIQNGDRICVGVSGGKDSLLLLFALSIYKQFSKKDFSLLAVTVHLGFEPFNTDKIEEFCKKHAARCIENESKKTKTKNNKSSYIKEFFCCHLCCNGNTEEYCYKVCKNLLRCF